MHSISSRLALFLSIPLWLVGPTVTACASAPPKVDLAMDGPETLLLQQPTISQDNIVFRHANDLWIVSRSGGEARRLTSSLGIEYSPQLSPDGKLVAFSGQYEGKHRCLRDADRGRSSASDDLAPERRFRLGLDAGRPGDPVPKLPVLRQSNVPGVSRRFEWGHAHSVAAAQSEPCVSE